MRKYEKVAVGGTFDELHKGHRVLLSAAFEIGERVVIGLSSDELVAKLGKPHITASYEERKQELEKWLQKQGWATRWEITPLLDAYGSSIRDSDIQALVVSQETRPNGEKINERRKSASLKPFEIIMINMVPSQNCGPISTTRIRRGEMDREGVLLNR
jgi:pantetheine-phosphate adenylyltransferase